MSTYFFFKADSRLPRPRLLVDVDVAVIWELSIDAVVDAVVDATGDESEEDDFFNFSKRTPLPLPLETLVGALEACAA